MRLALLHYSLPPVIGGVEKIVAQHAKLFHSHGHAVTAVFAQGEAPPGVSAARYPAAATAATLRDFLTPLLAQQDAVFLHNVCTMPFDLALTEALWEMADALPAVRFVSWIHDLAACNPDYTLTAAAHHRLSLPHPRMTAVAVSPHRAQQWTALTGAPCQVIPNGVDAAGLLGLRAPVSAWANDRGLLSRDFLLLHPARLLRRKNIELGLQVTAAIKATGRTCAYLVTGAADPHHAPSLHYAADLRNLRAGLALENDAFFLHDAFPVADCDLPALYTLADALFFPSRQEGFGLPPLEAALHRLSIFCSDIEALRNLPNQGVSRFPLDAEPAQIAALMMRQLDASPSIQARKAVLRENNWPAVYRKYLAPLLTESLTRLRP